MTDRPQARRVRAVGWIRSLSGNEGGGSQPHVFLANGDTVMVKTRNNPQGPRVVTNELLGGLCLDWLGVEHPRPAIVNIAQDVIDDSPAARYSNGNALEAGLAFGSDYWQSDPGGTINEGLIVNRKHVAGTLAFDTWVRQYDARQYRVRPSSSSLVNTNTFPSIKVTPSGRRTGHPPR